MRASPSTMLQVATGGKENELKLWNGSRPEAPVFQAKNVSYSRSCKSSVLVYLVGLFVHFFLLLFFFCSCDCFAG